MRRVKRQPVWKKIKVGIFFLALGVLMVVSLIPGIRPSESKQEKRKLAEFPEFSVESLFSGEYFSGIDDWFSDSFPGRETFIAIDQKVSDLFGVKTVEINGEVQGGDDIPEAPFVRG